MISASARPPAYLFAALLVSACSPALTANPSGISVPAVPVRQRLNPADDLIYASNSLTGDVMVFADSKHGSISYVGEKNVGSGMSGECVDARGDVFVTQDGGYPNPSQVYEFKHGALTWSAALTDPYPATACSVNQKTDELAVMGTVPGGSGYGVVALYNHASGKPSFLIEASYYLVSSCAYDSNGNLYLLALDGYTNGMDFLVEIPAGSTNFQMMSTDVSIYQGPYGGPTLQWADGHLIVSSYVSGNRQHPHAVYAYELDVNGTAATVVHTTVLQPHGHGYVGADLWLQRDTVLGFTRTQRGDAWMAFWSDANGGTPIAIYSDNYLNDQPQGLVGLVVSAR